jgi:hypothetical protein
MNKNYVTRKENGKWRLMTAYDTRRAGREG